MNESAATIHVIKNVAVIYYKKLGYSYIQICKN